SDSPLDNIILLTFISAAALAFACGLGTVLCVLFLRWRQKRILDPLRQQNPELYERAIAAARDVSAADDDGDVGSYRADERARISPARLQTFAVWKFGEGEATKVEMAPHSQTVVSWETVVMENGQTEMMPVSKEDSSQTLLPHNFTASGSSALANPDPERPPESPSSQQTLPLPSPTTPFLYPTPDACPICMDTFTPGVALRRLPCTHSFHVRCVDEWLVMRRGECPLCRRDFTGQEVQ
ncbi:hypothetical protein HDU93_004880, partial [Gonapodya sp. JEL0774]